MGKKQGQAQRTKGNIQPSSSAKAAEILEQVAANFSGYGTSALDTMGIALLDDVFDSNLDTEFRMILRKIAKKDSMTKLKGLEEFKALVDSKNVEECVKVIPYWAKQYTKLTIDIDRKIRETCQITHEKFCLKVKKNLAPNLKTIMPYWILAQCDTYTNASQRAINAFKNIFSDTKQPEVISFTKNEILSVISDYLIVETVNTISDLKNTSEDEALQKYEIVISMCFNGLNLLLNSLSQQAKEEICERLEKLLNDQKFWKFSKDKSNRIRGSFYQLINSILNQIPSSLVDKFQAKAIPLVFYSCDDDDHMCSYYIWKTILHCVQQQHAVWTIVNIKKAFLPKFYSILRHNINVNREAMFECIIPLFENIPDTLNENYAVFTETLNAIFDGLKDTKTRFNDENIAKQIECVFNCLTYLVKRYQSSNQAFCETLIENYLIRLTSDYLNSNDIDSTHSTNTKVQLEAFFHKFTSPEFEVAGDCTIKFFLNKLNEMLNEKDKSIKLTFNLINLFSKLQTSLGEFGQIVTHVYDDLLRQFKNTKSDETLQMLTKISIIFRDERYLRLFLECFDEPTGDLDTFNDIIQKRFLAGHVNFIVFDYAFVLNSYSEFTGENYFDQIIEGNFKQFLLNYFTQNAKSELVKSREYCLKFLNYIFLSEQFVTKLFEFLKSEAFFDVVLNTLTNVIRTYPIFVKPNERIEEFFRKIYAFAIDKLIVVSSNLFELKRNGDNLKSFVKFSQSFVDLHAREVDTARLWTFLLNILQIDEKLADTCVDKLVVRLNEEAVKEFGGFENYVEEYIRSRNLDALIDLICGLLKKFDKFANRSYFIENLVRISLGRVDDLEMYDVLRRSLPEIYPNIYAKHSNRLVLVNNPAVVARVECDDLVVKKLYFKLKLLNCLLNEDFLMEFIDFGGNFGKFLLNYTFIAHLNQQNERDSLRDRICLQFKVFLSTKNGLILLENGLQAQKTFDFNTDEIGLLYAHMHTELDYLQINKLDCLDDCLWRRLRDSNPNLELLRPKTDDLNEILTKFISFSDLNFQQLTNADLQTFFIQLQLNLVELFQHNANADILAKILDFFITIKFDLFEKLNTDMWLQLGVQQKYNQFLKLVFSTNLTANQLDFILLYITSESNKLDGQVDFTHDLFTNQIGQLKAISFFDLFYTVANTIANSGDMKLMGEWNEFFSKESYDILLPLYLRLCEHLASDFNGPLTDITLKYISTFSLVISKCPVERLKSAPIQQVLDVNDFEIMSKLQIDDRLQTILNKLYPLLNCHKHNSIQTCAYLLINKLIHDLEKFYENECLSDTDNLFQMLPTVIRTVLNEQLRFIQEFNVKFDFDENLFDDHDDECLTATEASVKYKYEGRASFQRLIENNKFMGYIYTNRLLLEMLRYASIELKFKFLNNIRLLNIHDHLINCLFRLMPNANSAELFELSINDEADLYENGTNYCFSVFYLQKYACAMYKYALKCTPVLIRDWHNSQSKRIFDYVDRYTYKNLSPILLANELALINTSEFSISTSEADANEYESSIRIRGMLSTREIVTVYKIKDLTMELVIKLPHNYPLGTIEVNCIKRIGVNENEWRNWMLQLTKYLMHQNGDIIEGVKIWKHNVDKKFNGVEECTICYSVIHSTNYQLPKMKCRTCRKKFHSYCLYKWFESSTKSTCPLCRNLF